MAFLRVSDTSEAGIINGLITTAREWVENGWSRALITQGFILYMDRFPWARLDGNSWPIQNGYYWQGIQLRRPPIQSVTSITYLDLQLARQTLSPTLYELKSNSSPGIVLPTYPNIWPNYFPRPESIQISFIAGYGTTGASVPARVKLAMKQLIAHWYSSREAVGYGSSKQVELSATALINSCGWGDYS